MSIIRHVLPSGAVQYVSMAKKSTGKHPIVTWTTDIDKAQEFEGKELSDLLISLDMIRMKKVKAIPNNMILFFDTETSGKPKNWKAPVTDLDNWPRVVQLGYQLYTMEGELYTECSTLIQPPEGGFNIHPEAQAIHGISEEQCTKEGNDLKDVLTVFTDRLQRCSVLVAHNMAFDRYVLGAEMIRAGLKSKNRPKAICTMLASKDVLKLPGRFGDFKWPKLQELHIFLFGEEFEGAHDALDDVKATARCFFELVKRGHISLSNS